MKIHFFTLTILIVLFSSCSVKDAEEIKYNYITIYSDSKTDNDSLIFRKFEKEEKIKVRFRYIPSDSILYTIKTEKFNSEADLILLSNYNLLKKASRKKLFLPIKSTVLEKNIDPIYHSTQNHWFGLSKTPLVVICHKNVLSKDRIKNYHELIKPEWKNKISLQEKNNQTMKYFENNIRFLLKIKADTFLTKLEKQSFLPRSGDDFKQIERVKNGETIFSIVKLSSLAESHFKYDTTNEKNTQKVQAIFPNQRKKGCFMAISGGGVHRYARNPQNAQKMLEFLSSNRAQYKYAEKRYEFPISKDVNPCFELEKFKKFRGRLYKY